MKCGDFVTAALQGDFGKRRPASVVQSDKFNDTHATVTVLLVSSELVDAPLFRITLQPNAQNTLDRPSQILVDKAMTCVLNVAALVGVIGDRRAGGPPRLRSAACSR